MKHPSNEFISTAGHIERFAVSEQHNNAQLIYIIGVFVCPYSGGGGVEGGGALLIFNYF